MTTDLRGFRPAGNPYRGPQSAPPLKPYGRAGMGSGAGGPGLNLEDLARRRQIQAQARRQAQGPPQQPKGQELQSYQESAFVGPLWENYMEEMADVFGRALGSEVDIKIENPEKFGGVVKAVTDLKKGWQEQGLGEVEAGNAAFHTIFEAMLPGLNYNANAVAPGLNFKLAEDPLKAAFPPPPPPPEPTQFERLAAVIGNPMLRASGLMGDSGPGLHGLSTADAARGFVNPLTPIIPESFVGDAGGANRVARQALRDLSSPAALAITAGAPAAGGAIARGLAPKVAGQAWNSRYFAPKLLKAVAEPIPGSYGRNVLAEGMGEAGASLAIRALEDQGKLPESIPGQIAIGLGGGLTGFTTGALTPPAVGAARRGLGNLSPTSLVDPDFRGIADLPPEGPARDSWMLEELLGKYRLEANPYLTRSGGGRVVSQGPLTEEGQALKDASEKMLENPELLEEQVRVMRTVEPMYGGTGAQRRTGTADLMRDEYGEIIPMDLGTATVSDPEGNPIASPMPFSEETTAKYVTDTGMVLSQDAEGNVVGDIQGGAFRAGLYDPVKSPDHGVGSFGTTYSRDTVITPDNFGRWIEDRSPEEIASPYTRGFVSRTGPDGMPLPEGEKRTAHFEVKLAKGNYEEDQGYYVNEVVLDESGQPRKLSQEEANEIWGAREYQLKPDPKDPNVMLTQKDTQGRPVLALDPDGQPIRRAPEPNQFIKDAEGNITGLKRILISLHKTYGGTQKHEGVFEGGPYKGASKIGEYNYHFDVYGYDPSFASYTVGESRRPIAGQQRRVDLGGFDQKNALGRKGLAQALEKIMDLQKAKGWEELVGFVGSRIHGARNTVYTSANEIHKGARNRTPGTRAGEFEIDPETGRKVGYDEGRKARKAINAESFARGPVSTIVRTWDDVAIGLARSFPTLTDREVLGAVAFMRARAKTAKDSWDADPETRGKYESDVDWARERIAGFNADGLILMKDGRVLSPDLQTGLGAAVQSKTGVMLGASQPGFTVEVIGNPGTIEKISLFGRKVVRAVVSSNFGRLDPQRQISQQIIDTDPKLQKELIQDRVRTESIKEKALGWDPLAQQAGLSKPLELYRPPWDRRDSGRNWHPLLEPKDSVWRKRFDEELGAMWHELGHIIRKDIYDLDPNAYFVLKSFSMSKEEFDKSTYKHPLLEPNAESVQPPIEGAAIFSRQEGLFTEWQKTPDEYLGYDNWSQEAEEKFAAGFLSYILDHEGWRLNTRNFGQLEKNNLAKVFDFVGRWLRDIGRLTQDALDEGFTAGKVSLNETEYRAYDQLITTVKDKRTLLGPESGIGGQSGLTVSTPEMREYTGLPRFPEGMPLDQRRIIDARANPREGDVSQPLMDRNIQEGTVPYQRLAPDAPSGPTRPRYDELGFELDPDEDADLLVLRDFLDEDADFGGHEDVAADLHDERIRRQLEVQRRPVNRTPPPPAVRPAIFDLATTSVNENNYWNPLRSDGQRSSAIMFGGSRNAGSEPPIELERRGRSTIIAREIIDRREPRRNPDERSFAVLDQNWFNEDIAPLAYIHFTRLPRNQAASRGFIDNAKVWEVSVMTRDPGVQRELQSVDAARRYGLDVRNVANDSHIGDWIEKIATDRNYKSDTSWAINNVVGYTRPNDLPSGHRLNDIPYVLDGDFNIIEASSDRPPTGADEVALLASRREQNLDDLPEADLSFIDRAQTPAEAASPYGQINAQNVSLEDRHSQAVFAARQRRGYADPTNPSDIELEKKSWKGRQIPFEDADRLLKGSVREKGIAAIGDRRAATEDTIARRREENRMLVGRGAGVRSDPRYAGRESAARASSALTPKGARDVTDIKFEPLDPAEFTEADLHIVFEWINRNPKMREYTKHNTTRAVFKLIDGENITRFDIVRLREVFGKELTASLFDTRGFKRKAFDEIMDILGIPRLLLATLDFSAPLRQGLLSLGGHPVRWTKTTGPAFRAALSGKYEEGLRARRENHANYALFTGQTDRLPEQGGGFGLHQTDPEAGMTDREEAFMSRFLQNMPNRAGKIPVIGEVAKPLLKGMGQVMGYPIRFSDRGYNSFLNELRFNLMNDAWENWKASGKGFNQDGSPTMQTIQDGKHLARWFNISTGRGDLGAAEPLAPLLANILFSPRLAAARLETPYELLRWDHSMRVKQHVVRDVAGTTMLGTTVLGLAAMAGVDVDLDPTSSDFGRMQIGNTRIDIWGGFQPLVRTFFRIAQQRRKSTGTGKSTDLSNEDLFNEFWSFWRNKLAPIPGFAADLLGGGTFTGDEINWEEENVKRELWNRFVPLMLQDLEEAYSEDGIRGAWLAVPSFFGTSVISYQGVEELARRDYKYPDGRTPARGVDRLREPTYSMFQDLPPFLQDHAIYMNKFETNRSETEFSELIESIDHEYWTELVGIVSNTETSDSVKVSQYFNAGNTRSDKRAGAFEAQYGAFEGTRDEPRDNNEKALQQYYQMIEDSTDADFSFNSEYFNATFDSLLATWTPEQEEWVRANTNTKDIPKAMFDLLPDKQKENIEKSNAARKSLIQKWAKSPDEIAEEQAGAAPDVDITLSEIERRQLEIDQRREAHRSEAGLEAVPPRKKELDPLGREVIPPIWEREPALTR